MAWVDDRVWCHPKFTDLTDRAGWTWVKGISYAAGYCTRGVLTPGQQRAIGSDKRTRAELVAANLWHELDCGAVEIHDWEEHNGKRDARREADRERKRSNRNSGTSAGASAGHSAGHSAGGSTVAARVEGSEGSDVKAKAVRNGSLDAAENGPGFELRSMP